MSDPASIAATITLLRRLTDPTASDFPATDFGPALNWEGVVAFASAQLVLPALYPAIEALGSAAPEAVQEFFLRVHAANAARNVEMRDALLSVGGALNHIGVAPVLLKGAAMLASHPESAVAWRFLSDLDLLLPGEKLPQAVAALKEIGFNPRETDYDPARDAHFPALIAPSGRFAVELHTRLFADATLPVLEVQLLGQADEMMSDGVRFRLPRLGHRIAHLIVHAQRQHAHYDTRRLLLRGFLELSMLLRPAPARDALSEALGAFATIRDRRMAKAYLAAHRLLMAPESRFADLEPRDLAWADRSVAALGQPPAWRASLAAIRLTGRGAVASLLVPAKLMRHFTGLLSPAGLYARIARHRARLRQAYWA